ncbi:MAG: HAMP domain-containing sensor histidine kinase [Oceanococcaceae bacterium]
MSLFRRIFPLLLALVLAGGALLSVLTLQVFHQQMQRFNADIVSRTIQVSAQSLRLYIEDLSTRAFLLSQSPLLVEMRPPDGSTRDGGNTEHAALDMLQAILRHQDTIAELDLLLPTATGENRLVMIRRGADGLTEIRTSPLDTVGHPALLSALSAPSQQVTLFGAEPTSMLQVSAPFDTPLGPGAIVLRSALQEAFATVLPNKGNLYLLHAERPTRLHAVNPSDTVRSDWADSLQMAGPHLPPGLSVVDDLMLFIPAPGKPHENLVLAMEVEGRDITNVLEQTVTRNIQALAIVLALLMASSYVVARRISAPIAQLRRILADKREDILATDLPSDADADLKALFGVILRNSGHIKAQQKSLTERLHALLQMQEQLNAAYLQLRQAEAEKDELVKVTAHDLREPLLIVKSCGALLPELIAEGSQDELSQTLRYIDTAIDRMSEQLERIRRYFSVGNSSTEPVPVNMAALFKDVLTALTAERLVCGAQVQLHGEGLVRADKEDMRALLDTLLRNALRYRRAFTPCIVQARISRVDEVLELQVTDNGIGIDPANHERIFSLFYHEGDSGNFRGTGTSLAEARKITLLQRGEIRVFCNPDNGVTFNVLLRDRLSPDELLASTHAAIPA